MPKKFKKKNHGNHKKSNGLYGDEQDSEDDPNTEDEFYSQSEGENSDGDIKQRKITVLTKYTKYVVVKEVGKTFMEYHLVRDERKDWDIAWYDAPPGDQFLKKMKMYQRVNHFPGMYNIAKKNMLGRHLMKMQKMLPDDFTFFPTSYVLPHDYKDFFEDTQNQKNPRTYIVKPWDESQGRGIFLLRKDIEKVKPKDQVVVQKYLHKPHLIDGYKYDLRLYVLLMGISPLRIYVYKDGLARFTTEKYEKPSDKNIDNIYMHLTNYAIQKEHENFVQNQDKNNDDVGSKRSFQSVLDGIEHENGSEKMEELQRKIYDIIIKSITLTVPTVSHLVKSCQPEDTENSMCFEVFGFDIMIDHKLTPFLLEINQQPSFKTDSPLDYKIKRGMIFDVMKKLCLSIPRKKQYQAEWAAKIEGRLLKPQRTMLPTHDSTGQPLGNTSHKQEARGTDSDLHRMSTIKGANAQDQGQQMERINEERKFKKEIKEKERQEKQLKKKKKMLEREQLESEVDTDLVLIYPLMTYERMFYLEDNFEAEEKLLKEELEAKKKELLEAAGGGEKKKVKVDPKKECFIKGVRDFVFDLNVVKTNTRGEVIEKPEKTKEQKEEVELHNQVYERLIRKMQGDLLTEDPDDDEDSDQEDVRDLFIRQRRYEKFGDLINTVWDDFTQGNAKEKNKKIKDDMEHEEQKHALQRRNTIGPGLRKLSTINKLQRRQTTILKKGMLHEDSDSDASPGHRKGMLQDHISESSGDVFSTMSREGSKEGRTSKNRKETRLTEETPTDPIKPEEAEPEKQQVQLIDQLALHEQMMHFSASEYFNKAKPGVKLPYVRPSKFLISKQVEAINGSGQSSKMAAHHLEYYKNMKEKYMHRQAQILQQQQIVQETLKNQILQTMQGDTSYVQNGSIADNKFVPPVVDMLVGGKMKFSERPKAKSPSEHYLTRKHQEHLIQEINKMHDRVQANQSSLKHGVNQQIMEHSPKAIEASDPNSPSPQQYLTPQAGSNTFKGKHQSLPGISPGGSKTKVIPQGGAATANPKIQHHRSISVEPSRNGGITSGTYQLDSRTGGGGGGLGLPQIGSGIGSTMGADYAFLPKIQTMRNSGFSGMALHHSKSSSQRKNYQKFRIGANNSMSKPKIEKRRVIPVNHLININISNNYLIMNGGENQQPLAIGTDHSVMSTMQVGPNLGNGLLMPPMGQLQVTQKPMPNGQLLQQPQQSRQQISVPGGKDFFNQLSISKFDSGETGGPSPIPLESQYTDNKPSESTRSPKPVLRLKEIGKTTTSKKKISPSNSKALNSNFKVNKTILEVNEKPQQQNLDEMFD